MKYPKQIKMATHGSPRVKISAAEKRPPALCWAPTTSSGAVYERAGCSAISQSARGPLWQYRTASWSAFHDKHCNTYELHVKKRRSCMHFGFLTLSCTDVSCAADCADVNIVSGVPAKRLNYRHVHYPERLCKTVATIRVVKGSFSRIAVAKLSQHSKAKACELPGTTSSDADGLRADAPVYLVGLAVQKVQPICHLHHIQHVSSWTVLLLVTPNSMCMQMLVPAYLYVNDQAKSVSM